MNNRENLRLECVKLSMGQYMEPDLDLAQKIYNFVTAPEAMCAKVHSRVRGMQAEGLTFLGASFDDNCGSWVENGLL